MARFKNPFKKKKDDITPTPKKSFELNDTAVESTIDSEINKGLVKAISVGLKLAAASRTKEQGVEVTKIFGAALSNPAKIFKASKALAKAKKELEKETGLSKKDFKLSGEDAKIKAKILESKFVSSLLADKNLWKELSSNTENIKKILKNYRPEISDVINKIITSEPSVEKETILKLIGSLLKAENSIDSIGIIISNNSDEVLALFEKDLKPAVSIAISILPLISKSSDAIHELFKISSPAILKVLDSQKKRQQDNFDPQNDLNLDNKKTIAHSIYNFITDLDFNKVSKSLLVNDTFRSNTAKFIGAKNNFSDNFQRDILDITIKFAGLLLDTKNLAKHKKTFEIEVNNILDETVSEKNSLKATFKIIDIFISQVESKEGEMVIKNDLKNFLQTHKNELSKFGDNLLNSDPQIVKLGIKADKIIDALTKDGMYKDILKLYELFKKDRKIALTGKGIKLFATNRDARVLAFNVIKSVIISFFRDTLYPEFLKRALVNNTCHTALEEISKKANEQSNTLDLRNELANDAKNMHGFKGYALKYASFNKLDLRNIEFKNLKMDNINLNNTMLGSGNGLVLQNCILSNCKFNEVQIRQGNISLSNSKIDIKTLLSLVDTLKFAENHNYRINVDGMKISNIKSLGADDLAELKTSKTISKILDELDRKPLIEGRG